MRAYILILALTFMACGIEQGTSLEILMSPKATSGCTWDDKTPVTQGFYDPRGFINAAPDRYVMGIHVKNHMQIAAMEQARGFSGENRRPESNDALIMGFNVCWVRADSEGAYLDASQYGAWNSGIPSSVKCSNLPNSAKTFITRNGMATCGGGSVILSLDLLTPAVLHSLYGDTFEPALIPEIGKISDSVMGDRYLYEPQPSDSADRDSNWGNFPRTRSAVVVLQLQAVAKLQEGSTVNSNWFVFSVEICPGCLSDYCGALKGCEDGSDGYQGNIVKWEQSCLPAQRETIQCTTGQTSSDMGIDTCP